MRALSAAALTALFLAVGGGSAHGAGGIFVVVEGAGALPSAEVPNPSGSVELGPELLTPPAVPQQLAFADLQRLWIDAGAAYGIPWQVLAAVNKIESNFGQNMGPSSAGAIGWMQFLPSTWLRWGVDADGDGVANPWNAADGIYSAARYLAAAGGGTDISRGLFAYNHAHWYVEDVLELADAYGQGGLAVPTGPAALTSELAAAQAHLEEAEARVEELGAALAEAVREEQTLTARWRTLDRRATFAGLLSRRLALRKRAVLTGLALDAAAVETQALRDELAVAEEALAAARAGSLSFASAPGTLFGSGAPLAAGDYVFPVGGGPGVVSVSHTHHDYPAADIAAPEGAPLYAHTDGVVVRGWALPEGRCGIGFTMRAADGRSWTYCHLSYLEPAVSTGALLTAGIPVGLVGSTGTHSSGPHLHLQLAPATSYPQAEPWFLAFAGAAFSWQDPAPVHGGGAPVFEVVPTVEQLSEGPIVLFERAGETASE